MATARADDCLVMFAQLAVSENSGANPKSFRAPPAEGRRLYFLLMHSCAYYATKSVAQSH
jgi:hypothetical protein